MDRILHFFENYTDAIGASKVTQRNTLAIIKNLVRGDPFEKTKFELSFKLKNDTISNRVRFLNIDGGIYSCKSQQFFLARLEIYKEIMKNKIDNSLLPDVIQALTSISKTPMDLYFGADIKDDVFLFAFWLIFGGVKRTGEVNFWPYNFNEIVNNALTKIKFKKSMFLINDILNFGLDIDNKDVFYKLYYLLRDKESSPASFGNLIKRINRILSDFRFFYFFSRMYNKEGKCIKKKLFIEFLEDIYPNSRKINELLGKVLEINHSRFELPKLFRIIKSINGRLSLISFEPYRVLTFYIRPD